MTANILLTTLNARYMHTAFGLRYLYANLGDLRSQALMQEFTIQQRPIDIAEKLLQSQPVIIGFSVYIWNVTETREVIALIKTIASQVIIIVGGPEVSFPADFPEVCDQVDHVITGPGEISFRRLCRNILAGESPLNHVIAGETADLKLLKKALSLL